MLEWRNFKTDPPYDAKEDEERGYETDRVSAWFTYRYTNRDWETPLNLSYKACEFFDGVFTEYKSHMRDSPYPEDWIEIIAWVGAKEVRDLLKTTIIQP